MFTGKLFPYQVADVDSIVRLKQILVAYSMGTGKTVMTIAALEEMFGNGNILHALILAPASLKFQWAQRIAEFTDTPTREISLKGVKITVPVEDVCVIINGTPKQRSEQWEKARYADYVIASYGAVLNDWGQLTSLPVDALILDEVTAIKNFKAQTSKRIKKLQPPVRIGLSGTPVENQADDAFSIMEWVDRTVLGRFDLFDKSFIERNHFGGILKYKNLNLFHQRLSKRMVRKSCTDPEVAKYLPAVTETTKAVVLDKTTREIYNAILDDLRASIEELIESGRTFDLAAYYTGSHEGGDFTAQGKVMSRMQAARMLLDHPQLLMDSAVEFHEGRGGSQYIAEFTASRYELPDMFHSPKLAALDELVEEMLGDAGTKVVVFSEYRRMLPYLEGRLEKHAGIVLFHGGMNSASKAAAKARFDNESEYRIMIATNAGGYGLDLPTARYLINYDLPYSSGVLKQRNTRHVRASSAYSRVYVANLVVEDSLEERVQANLRLRGSLADQIIDGVGAGVLAMDVESLGEHLDRAV